MPPLQHREHPLPLHLPQRRPDLPPACAELEVQPRSPPDRLQNESADVRPGDLDRALAPRPGPAPPPAAGVVPQDPRLQPHRLRAGRPERGQQGPRAEPAAQGPKADPLYEEEVEVAV